MKQIPFADAQYAGKRKQTRRERFLIEVDQVVPRKGYRRQCGRRNSGRPVTAW